MKLEKSKIDEEVYYYFLKSGEKRWMYRHKYKDTSGKRREKKKSSFETEKAAYRALLKVKADLLDGNHTKVENDQITVSQWLDIWYETYSVDWEVSTKKQRRLTIDDIINPRIGELKLLTLDRSTYKRLFINDLLKTFKPSTVNQYHTRFMAAVNAAVEDDILTRNKFGKMKVEDNEQSTNFLTPKELNTFLWLSKKQKNITSHTMIVLLAYTGLRQGEALGLKWKNIDFKQKTVTVEATRDNYGLRSPKTKNSYRTIGIDDLVIKQLKLYQKWCLERKFTNGEKLDKENDFVFISKNDAKPCSYMVLHNAIKNIYKACGEKDIKLNKITPHGLRHTHATTLINNGIPARTVAERLGNTVKVVNSLYSHSFKEIEDKAVSVFSDIISGANTGAN